MQTLSHTGIQLLIGILAIFCLLSGRLELGVLFLVLGLIIPLAHWVAKRLEMPTFPHQPEM